MLQNRPALQQADQRVQALSCVHSGWPDAARSSDRCLLAKALPRSSPWVLDSKERHNELCPTPFHTRLLWLRLAKG